MYACYKKGIIVISALYIRSKMKCAIVVFFSQKVLNLFLRALFITWKYSYARWDFIRTTLAHPQSLQGRLFRLGCKMFCCSVLHNVCPLNREKKHSASVPCSC